MESFFHPNEVSKSNMRRILDTMQIDEIFKQASTYREQCLQLEELFRTTQNSIPFSHLCLIFKPQVTKSSVQQQIAKSDKIIKYNGRPSSLSSEEMDKITQWIKGESFPKILSDL